MNKEPENLSTRIIHCYSLEMTCLPSPICYKGWTPEWTLEGNLVSYSYSCSHFLTTNLFFLFTGVVNLLYHTWPPCWIVPPLAQKGHKATMDWSLQNRELKLISDCKLINSDIYISNRKLTNKSLVRRIERQFCGGDSGAWVFTVLPPDLSSLHPENLPHHTEQSQAVHGGEWRERKDMRLGQAPWKPDSVT